jgi:polysaccharide chain length determinant protein (PEP-CTERM system associated)
MEWLMPLVRRETRAAWRNRWTGVAFAWLLCLVGWTGVMLMPDQYETSARVFVDADAVLTPLLRGLSIDTSFNQQVDVLQRTLLSRPNLEKLVYQTDLQHSLRGPSDLERLVAELADQIKVRPETRGLFTVTYRNHSAKLTYDVVRTMVATFVESTGGTNRSGMENARLFMEGQIANYEQQLRAAERRRADFKEKYVDLLATDANGGMSHLEEAQNSLRLLLGSLEDALAKRETLTHELESTAPLLVTETDPGSPGGGGNGQRLAEAGRTLQELRLRDTEQHPDVVAARNRVAALLAGGNIGADASAAPVRPARSRSTPNPVFEQLKVRLVETDSVVASLKRQVADATRQRDRLEAIAHTAPGLQAEYININRDYDVLRRNYEELLSRRESMRIAAAAETSEDKERLRIVDPPQMPRVPVAPRRALFVSTVLLLGLSGGVAVTFLLARLDGSFRSLTALHSLGLPVLGGISLVVAAVPLRRRLVTAGTLASAVLLLCVIFVFLLHQFAITPGVA